MEVLFKLLPYVFPKVKPISSNSGEPIEFDMTESFHARSIETDTGWKISIDRGLDIFQPYNYKDALSLAATIQEERMCKQFEVTYIKS